MHHNKGGKKLGRTGTHRRAMFRNLSTELFRHERIETTLGKAKALRPIAEKLITLAKRGDLHARRLAGAQIQDAETLKKLFNDIGERYQDRPGGYLRILKLENRIGDNAAMARIELVEGGPVVKKAAPAAEAAAE
ncbi:MAG: 50S ribosomal protein L17 [Deltaproteobacteria bacterium]|nr:50S ribosomal protein L17 [Deltaproteobacteria bacterium]MBT6432145.1 50S ribosomal protein L17 [Deltaproteobacteria bacterium]MBT6492009.1 50S ribosomal protein L17 [Deltaproteobacteria bacterium]